MFWARPLLVTPRVAKSFVHVVHGEMPENFTKKTPQSLTTGSTEGKKHTPNSPPAHLSHHHPSFGADPQLPIQLASTIYYAHRSPAIGKEIF